MPNPPNPAHWLTTIEAAARLGVSRHTLRSMEARGQLKRAGTVATIGARGVVYELAEVEAAAERLRVARLPPPPKPLRAPLHPPPGMMLAVDVARECGVDVGTVKGWCRSGRLRPAACMVSPSRALLFTVEDVRDAETVREFHAPQNRISAVVDELNTGASIADAIARVGVSRTTWNYWVRHRRDAAAVAASVRVVEEESAEVDAREVMARVLAKFEQGATIRDALMSEGLGPTDHQKWIIGTASAPYACRWFAAEYARMRTERGKADAARRAQEKSGAAEGWASQVGWVYFVSGTGKADAVKIGWASKSVADRVRGLQVGSPVELRVLVSVVAMCAFERWCHRQFDADRLYGEWFRRTPRLSGFMARLAAMGDVSGLSPADMTILLQNPQTHLFGGAHGPTP